MIYKNIFTTGTSHSTTDSSVKSKSRMTLSKNVPATGNGTVHMICVILLLSSRNI